MNQQSQSKAIHPIAVTKAPYGAYVILEGRLRALVRQQAGETSVPILLYNLVEDEWAAWRWAGTRNRHTRPTTVSS